MYDLKMIIFCSFFLLFWFGNTKNIKVTIDWTNIIGSTSTAATIEVDVMPFLSRVHEGGPFDSYFEALSNLDAYFVRFAPWYPYPKVVVAELEESDCAHNKTSWNTTLFDNVMRDFYTAVCGPDAAKGVCKKSVAQQLSTMPAWMYIDGADINEFPADPWQFPSGKFNSYVKTRSGGTANQLRDPTCKEMARYVARLIGWYTAGGMVDECGTYHKSDLFYKMEALSVLNEDEHQMIPEGGVQYTICFDAWRDEIRKVNPNITLMGPEIVGNLGYSLYFLNASNHANNEPPKLLSNHVALFGPSGTGSYEKFFSGVDDWITNIAEPLKKAGEKMSPHTEFVMNEFIPFMNDWCNGSTTIDGCPDWTNSKSHGTQINRKTLGWNAAAASFAYAFGRLSEMEYKAVGADQLVSGPWPDNEPAVSSMDWNTGEPNAKYWAVNMLAKAMGVQKRTLYQSHVEGTTWPVGKKGKGTCGFTWWKDCSSGDDSGAWNTTEHNIKNLEDCVKKCQSCDNNCNFVSLSLNPDHQDCSWYKSCPFDNLVQVGANYTSEVVHTAPGPAPLYALPYIIHNINNSDQNKKGVLLVSKIGSNVSVQLLDKHQVHSLPQMAQVLEGVGSEPGFSPPVVRTVGADGSLELGPYGIALVSF